MKRFLTLGLLLVMAAVAALAVASAPAKPPPTPPPAFSFTPAGPYDFGAIDVGGSSSMDFTLSYQGKGGSGPISISVTGGSTFTISADACTGKRISTRKSCTITVSYSPTAVGSTDTAQLTASATGVATATNGLTGTGLATCTAGSENFSSAAVGSQPTTFAGGTMDDDWGDNGHVMLAEDSWAIGGYPAGTHIVYTGGGMQEPVFFLRFDKAVGSVQVETYPYTGGATMRLEGWDASGVVIDTDSQSGGQQKYTLAIASTSDNIKILKFSATDTYSGMYGFTFTNLVWTCN